MSFLKKLECGCERCLAWTVSNIHEMFMYRKTRQKNNKSWEEQGKAVAVLIQFKFKHVNITCV